MKKFLKTITIIFLMFAIPISMFYFLNSFLDSKNSLFSYPLTFCGININGLTKSDAEEKINKNIQLESPNKTLTLSYLNKNWTFANDDFLVCSNIHTILDEVYKYNNKFTYQSKAQLAKKIKNMGFENKVAVNYVFIGMEEKLNKIISEINYSPQDATVFYNKSENKLNFTQEKSGIKVDKEKLYEKIYNFLQNEEQSSIEIPILNLAPKVTKKQLENSVVKQSTFSTSYISSSSDRKNNIKIATEKLNGYEIKPNQTFSFNEAVGKRLSENGYKEANIIKDGNFVKGVGGGVCQVSTTLYNALILANIDILEVHKHSLPVSYVKPGLDAMVSWSTADLKFKNTTNSSIFIFSSCNGSTLTFSIYGNTKEKNVKIVTRSEIVKEIPFEKDIILPDLYGKYADKIMFKGEYIREKYGKNGYEANAYIDYYENGIKTKTKLIRNCTYEAQNGILYEGTETLPEGMTLPQNKIQYN